MSRITQVSSQVSFGSQGGSWALNPQPALVWEPQVPFRTGGSPASSVALRFAYQAESLWIFPIEGAFFLPAALLAAFVYYYF